MDKYKYLILSILISAAIVIAVWLIQGNVVGTISLAVGITASYFVRPAFAWHDKRRDHR